MKKSYQKGEPASRIGDGQSAFQQRASTGVIRRCPAFRNLKLNQHEGGMKDDETV
jgi:hypothetical protein